MEISAKLVKELRDRTGAGMMECKKALVEAKGNLAEAEIILRKHGIASAAKKADAHHAARRDRQLHSSGIAVGRAGGSQLRVRFRRAHRRFPGAGEGSGHADRRRRSAVHPARGRHAAALEKENDIQRGRALQEGKPEKMLDKIVEGRMNKFYEEVCLYEQPFIRENTTTVADLIKSMIAKLGENISVSRFVRFKVGEAALIEETAESSAPQS